MTTANDRLIPYSSPIAVALNVGGIRFDHDTDISATDAHYFWTVSCDDRPSIQLFIALSWTDGEHAMVTTTIDVRTKEEQDPIPCLGMLTLSELAPSILSRIVLQCADSFHQHGHI